jgi:hypothetical protein
MLLLSDVPAILMVLALLVVLVALSGCAPLPSLAASPTQNPTATEPAPTPLAPQGPFKDTTQPGEPVSRAQEFDVLVSDLRAAGAQVELGEAVNEPFFSAPGLKIIVNGLSVMVFEYNNPAVRQIESDKISQDGFSVGNAQVDWVDAPNFWAKSRLIVLYVGRNTTLIAQLSQLLGDPITLIPPSGGLVTMDKAPFALAARKALSQKLGLPEDQITFVSAEPEQWSNSCLGLAGKNEMCLMVITNGYTVMFSAGGRSYEVHTDESGRSVRIK